MKFFGLLSEQEVGMLNYAVVEDNSRYYLTGNHLIRNIIHHSNGTPSHYSTQFRRAYAASHDTGPVYHPDIRLIQRQHPRSREPEGQLPRRDCTQAAH